MNPVVVVLELHLSHPRTEPHEWRREMVEYKDRSLVRVEWSDRLDGTKFGKCGVMSERSIEKSIIATLGFDSDDRVQSFLLAFFLIHTPT